MINCRRMNHAFELRAVAGLVCSLALSLAVARQPELESTGHVVFHDDFSEQDLDRGRWAAVNGASLSPTGDAGVSVPGGLGRRAALRSRGIVLDEVGAAVLFFTVAFDGGDDPGLFVVEYRSHDREWRLLSSVESRAAQGLARSATAVLPADALHDRFSMRFRAESDSVTGLWRLLDVRVETFAHRGILSVAIADGAEGSISVARAGMESVVEAAPFVWAMPLGDSVTLVAPSRLDQEVFGHWIVNHQFVGGRFFSDPFDDHVFAEAYYTPVGPKAKTAFIYVGGVFSGDLAVTLALEPAPAYSTIVIPSVHEVLVGEKLRLSAPTRVEDQVFHRWVLDGSPAETFESDLYLEVSGDVQLIAEYLCVGDMNADGRIDEFDVDAFAMALADPAGYAEQFPDIDPFSVGDLNADGRLDEGDVDPFVRLFFDR